METKVYRSSSKKILIVASVLFLVMLAVFSFARGSFEVEGFKLGLFFGALPALLITFFGYGQVVKVSQTEVIYSSSLLTLLIDGLKVKIPVNELTEIRLGLPKINQTRATFAAINISSQDKEITFNPDLFDNGTLQSLFAEIKRLNESVKMDDYATSIMETGGDKGAFPKKVLGNFLGSALLIVLVGLITIFMYKSGIASKKAVYLITGTQIIFIPIVYNFLANKLKK